VFTTNGYPIGTLFGGGKIAYVLKSDDPGYVEGEFHGLIMSLDDQHPSDGDYPARWSPPTFYSNLVTSLSFGSGLNNTNSLIQSFSNMQRDWIKDTAAGLARNYNGGSFTDWYLPSYTELIKIISNYSGLSLLNAQRRYWKSSTDHN